MPLISNSRSKRAAALLGLIASCGAALGCAKIVGIEDTNVTRGDAGGGANEQGGNTSSAGAAHAGTSNAGSLAGGHANGGSSPSVGGSAGFATSSGGRVDTAGTGGSGSATSAGTGGSAGSSSECPCSAPKPTCENGKCVVRGPTMAEATGVGFYIDSTEVSKAQYDVFLKAKGSDTSGQIAECAWNTSYAPSGSPVDNPRPIVNVDWCDATAFCAWADKRLCGAIGGGPVLPDDLKNAAKSQMYRACAGASDDYYPYGGSTRKPDYCNAYSSGDMADVGTFPKCEGHYTGIFDLVGNAAEWIDSCDMSGGTDRSMDNCELGGGSYLREDYTCQYYYSYQRGGAAEVFGFRCCSK
ncbi:MAG TPA: SUMF1/EgtB/PvdO family nonheme iron enzyme [Polyangiaceae bacterium]|nr:SUMF1/EgtB/PvdO family nonheme iron enzyme [Polyangiaceae bacterium]